MITLDKGSRGAISFRLLANEIEDRFELSGRATKPEAKENRPGPGGRGFGVPTEQPKDVDRAWPPSEPWTDDQNVIELDKEDAMNKAGVRD